jgi:hypothetical protein
MYMIPYMVSITTFIMASSRFLLFQISDPVLFTLAGFLDILCTTLVTLFSPRIDAFFMRYIWGRCVDNPAVEPQRALMVRMLIFQAQTVLDLGLIFSTAFRSWAFWDNRYVFPSMYKHTCDDSLELDALLQKVVISVLYVLASDMLSSYIFFFRGYPLQLAFIKILHSKVAWFMIFVMMIMSATVAPYQYSALAGLEGECKSFDDGCTCLGIKMWKAICGCCSDNPSREICST